MDKHYINPYDLDRLDSLSFILEKDKSEILHMAISLLLLKTKLPSENKEMVIINNNGEISSIIYGNNCK